MNARPALVMTLVCLVAAGCTAGAAGPVSTPHPATGPPTVPLPAGPLPLPVAEPITATALDIPAIGLSTSALEPLGLQPDGALAAPVQWQRAGYFADGPVPGERGPAVVAGHVDSVSGPAVFFRLAELRPGDRIDVGRSDGRSITFEVDRLVSVPKDSFPTDLIYGPTPDAQLRLITCGGDFDRAARSYVDNTVVLATAVG